MSRPLIGVTGRRWPAAYLGDHVPPAMRGLFFDLHFADYTRSIALAGGLPVELSRDADVDAVVARLDGLVLSGGADVEPARYGAVPEPGLGDVEPDRDAWELALFEAAQRRALPVLAICRGLQLVNVARGGTLVQDVPLDTFAALRAGDVLFVDSSHVVKTGSDVHHLFTKVLPVLCAGVVVHVHDVFWPFEYLRHWISEGRAWNEAYLLHAFLMYNDTFEIVLWNHWLATAHPEIVASELPAMLENPGGALWMRRR